MHHREQSTFYVTTPIYYVTARPHLGSLYSTVLADVAARWHALKGARTFMLTGTDEHGQKVAQAAHAVGKEPQAFVDSFITAFKETWAAYNIDVSHFMRTTDEHHKIAVQKWICDLQERGDIYRSTYEGYYCTPCETFVTEREEGDSVPRCPSCSRATVLVSEPCYFFRLSAYQDKLLAFYEAHPEFIVPKERINEVISFVKSGLKDLAISRARSTVSWGIPFPGDESQVVYVWADALNNYISAVGYGDPKRAQEFAQWWPAQLHVLGKDIVRFHAVFWPAFLMAANLPLPQQLLVHGWIKIGGEKMSKSLGNVVDPMVLQQQYTADVVRYYLVRHIAVTHDAPFSIEDLRVRNNADLADDVGNLVQRIVSLATARGIATLDMAEATPTDVEGRLMEQIDQVCLATSQEMESYMFHRAYSELWKGFALVNQYVHEQQPWKVTDTQRLKTILATASHATALLAFFVWPVMPDAMERLGRTLGIDLLPFWQNPNTIKKFTFTKSAALFPKYEAVVEEIATPQTATQKNVATTKDTMNEQSTPEAITIQDFGKVELLVGTITQVELVPKSDKLYKLTVDLGPAGVRTICSGVRAHFTAEELLNKQGIFVANLAPRMMLGIPSQGMMLFVEDAQGVLKMVTPAVAVPNGVRLR